MKTFSDHTNIEGADVLEYIDSAEGDDVDVTITMLAGAMTTGDVDDKKKGVVRNRVTALEKSGLVEADKSSSPYTYTLTDDGHEMLENGDADEDGQADEGADDIDDVLDGEDIPDADEIEKEDDSSTNGRDGIQADYTVGEGVSDERERLVRKHLNKAAGDWERMNRSPELPRDLHTDGEDTRQMRLVKPNNRVRCPGSGLIVSYDAVEDGLVESGADVDDLNLYARDPYCGSFRKLAVSKRADGPIVLKFRSHNIPMRSPRTRTEEFIGYDDSDGQWKWMNADEDEVQSDELVTA